MFLGQFRHIMDAKGRLFIPARFRSQENQRFYITRGLDCCLFVFPEEEWNRWQARVGEMDMMKKDARAFNRFFFSGTAEAVCDKQGRINLPANLIEYARMNKEAVIVGVCNRFEIWSVEIWEQYEQESGKRYEDIAENLVD